MSEEASGFKSPRALLKSEIECKVKMISEKGCLVLLYKTARTDMEILDETYGPENWQCSYETVKDNLYCSISVYDKSKGAWVSKSDCGVESDQDSEKGEASDAFKRAGFKWGIGRELYTTPFIWLSVRTTQIEGKRWVLADRRTDFEVESISVSDTGHGKEISELSVVAKSNGFVEARFDYPKKQGFKKPEEPKASETQKKQDPEILKSATDEFNRLPIARQVKANEWILNTYSGRGMGELSDGELLSVLVFLRKANAEEAKEGKQNG